MIRKTTDGHYLVTLPLSPEFTRVAMDNWERLGYSSPEDYLSAVLNIGMLGEEEAEYQYHHTEPENQPWTGSRPTNTGPDDMDDGIPF